MELYLPWFSSISSYIFDNFHARSVKTETMVYIVADGMVHRNSLMNCFRFCIHTKTSSSSSNSTRNFEISFATSVVSGVPPHISPSYE